MRRTAYIGSAELPDEIVTSTRCIVRVGDRVVVCTNRDGASHPWPGGRREPGETVIECGYREVHEETGWLVDPASFRPLGWLHLELLNDPVPPDYLWPYPDALHVVFVATATERADTDWTDTEGYELSSCLMTIDEAYSAVEGDALSRVFLDLLR